MYNIYWVNPINEQVHPYNVRSYVEPISSCIMVSAYDSKSALAKAMRLVKQNGLDYVIKSRVKK